VGAEDEKALRIAQREEGYRAIGRFVAVFSQLIVEMRTLMLLRLQRRGDPPRLISLPFGGVTAEPITNAFFAMCRMLMDHEKDELETAAKLRTEVMEAIKLRNGVVHGDWYVGYGSIPVGNPPQLVEPWAERTTPSRTTDPFKPVAVDLDGESDAMERLALLVVEYGRVCFGRHYLQRAGRGGVRVREVVAIRKVKHRKSKVVPGPKAGHSKLQEELRDAAT
jgi:hypothetical protein